MPKGVHNGTCVSFWASDAEIEKLAYLSTSSGQSRTKVIKDLINEKRLPDKSYWKTYRQLASLGGLIKKFVDNGDHGNAYQLGCEVLAIARELERLEKEGK